MSRERFEYIRSGNIDLHDGFKLAEDAFSYIVKVPFLEEGNSTVEVIACERLSDDMLPLPGEFINLATQTLPVLPSEELEQRPLSL